MSERIPIGKGAPAVAVTVAAITLIVLAALSAQWLGTDERGVGLRELEMCSAYGCDRVGIDTVMTRPFVLAGLVTFIASWVAAGGLLLAGLPVLAGVRSALAKTAVRFGQLGLVVSLGGAVVFLMQRPGGEAGLGLSIGFWMFAGGNVLGLTAAQMLAKLHSPPVDPG